MGRLANQLAVSRRAQLGAQAARLDSLSPLAVLGRGYALVRRSADGAIVRRAQDVAVGDSLAVRLAEIDVEATVDSVLERKSVKE